MTPYRSLVAIMPSMDHYAISDMLNAQVVELYYPSDLCNQADKELDFYFLHDVSECTESVIVVRLRSNMGEWLSSLEIGENLFDPAAQLYLWKFPRAVLEYIASFVKAGGYAGMTLEEYVRGMYTK